MSCKSALYTPLELNVDFKSLRKMLESTFNIKNIIDFFIPKKSFNSIVCIKLRFNNEQTLSLFSRFSFLGFSLRSSLRFFFSFFFSFSESWLFFLWLRFSSFSRRCWSRDDDEDDADRRGGDFRGDWDF